MDNGQLQIKPCPPTQSLSGITVSSLQGTLNIADMGGRKLDSPESWRFEATLDDGHMVHAPVGSFKQTHLTLTCWATSGNGALIDLANTPIQNLELENV